ncbi:LysR family transcriptional regulator [bacterium]|nr:LysR family transcriptional regulator [bacterium]
MSFRTAELFCAVADCRSFSRAADANGISQSSVSQAVAHLERALGVTLIDRRTRPLTLTAAGQTYYEGCRDLLDRFRELNDSVQRLTTKVCGRLRVAAIYSIGLQQMDGFVHDFSESHPEVDLRVDYLHPEEVYDRVATDAADIGIVSFPKDSGDFAAIPWQQQPFVLVVPPGHRLAGLASGNYSAVPVSELSREELVHFTPELPVRRRLDQWLKEKKVTPRVIHEFDNVEQIRRAVEDSVGVALLPAPAVERSVETGTLISLELADVDWTRPLGIIHKRHRALSNAANRFVEMLRDDPHWSRMRGHTPQTTGLSTDTVNR